jgi:hypothetical protein
MWFLHYTIRADAKLAVHTIFCLDRASPPARDEMTKGKNKPMARMPRGKFRKFVTKRQIPFSLLQTLN